MILSAGLRGRTSPTNQTGSSRAPLRPQERGYMKINAEAATTTNKKGHEALTKIRRPPSGPALYGDSITHDT